MIEASQIPPEPLYSSLAAAQKPPAIGGLMARALANPDLLSLGAGFTDNTTLPVDLVRDLVSRILNRSGAETTLQYGTNQGRVGLREEICRFLEIHPGESSEQSHPDNVMITNGSQQALYLATQSLCDPGDLVLVERPTYFVFQTILQGLNIKPIGIPCQADGSPDLNELDALLSEMNRDGSIRRLKAAYLVTYFSNPSTRSHSVADKEGIAKVLERHHPQLPVIEDAAYRELFFEEPHPVPSILSMSAYKERPLLYLGTFTKPFATGLKVGYGICNQPAWRDKMLWMKGYQDFGTSHFAQAIIEEVLRGGHYPDHLKRLRAGYRNKATIFGHALEQQNIREMGWRWRAPFGGLYYWVEGPPSVDTSSGEEFCESALNSGVLYVPGNLCFPDDSSRSFMRLSYGSLSEEKLQLAVKRLGKVIRDFTRKPVLA